MTNTQGEEIEAASVVEDASRSARQVAENFEDATLKSVRDQPLTTLGIAIVIGFVLGAVWKA